MALSRNASIARTSSSSVARNSSNTSPERRTGGGVGVPISRLRTDSNSKSSSVGGGGGVSPGRPSGRVAVMSRAGSMGSTSTPSSPPRAEAADHSSPTGHKESPHPSLPSVIKLLPPSKASQLPQGRWSKLYLSRINETQVVAERDREKETAVLSNVAACVVLLQRCAKRFKARLHAKLALAKLSAAKQLSLQHFEMPEPPARWQFCWGKNVHCYFCKRPTISDSVSCLHCGSIAHRLCAQEARSSETNIELAIRSSSKRMVSQKQSGFICESCSTFYAGETQYYMKCYDKLAEVKYRDFCKGVISKALVTYITRCRQIKKERALQLLRNAMKRYSLVKMYHIWKRSCLRVIVLDVVGLPNVVTDMNDKCIIILTVVDPVKHAQLFRIDKKPDTVIDEGSNFL
jgi:hypothetical protein